MTSVWVGKAFAQGGEVPADEPVYFGAKHITTPTKNIHPVPGRDSSPCVTTGVGQWKDKIYHFLPDMPPSSAGEEIQTEYFVTLEKFPAAMEALFKNRKVFNHLTQVTEIRMAKADNIPFSPVKGDEARIGIHFTWKRMHDPIVAVLPALEEILAPFGVKPHFGKIFNMSGKKFEELFEKKDINTLRALILHHDPNGKFRNEYIDNYVFNNAKTDAAYKKNIMSTFFPYNAKM